MEYEEMEKPKIADLVDSKGKVEFHFEIVLHDDW